MFSPIPSTSMNSDQLRRSLRQKWLDYYRDNRLWVSRLAVWTDATGDRRPVSSFIVATLSVLEPNLTHLLPLIVDLSSDPDRVIEALGLDFDPEAMLGVPPEQIAGQSIRPEVLPASRTARTETAVRAVEPESVNLNLTDPPATDSRNHRAAVERPAPPPKVPSYASQELGSRPAVATGPVRDATPATAPHVASARPPVEVPFRGRPQPTPASPPPADPRPHPPDPHSGWQRIERDGGARSAGQPTHDRGVETPNLEPPAQPRPRDRPAARTASEPNRPRDRQMDRPDRPNDGMGGGQSTPRPIQTNRDDRPIIWNERDDDACTGRQRDQPTTPWRRRP